jgi:hypothetical protein
MSWVATVMLSVGFGEEAQIDQFNDWLEHECPWNGPSFPPDAMGVGNLARLSGEDWGGEKAPEAELWGGALNHADLTAVVDRAASLPWREPAQFQLLIKDQEESYFRLWMFRDGELRQFAPGPSHGGDW